MLEESLPFSPPRIQQRPKWISRIRRRSLLRVCVIFLAFPLLGWLTFRAAIAWWPYPAALERTPAASTFINDRAGVSLAALVAADGQWRVPLREEEISPHLLKAIVAVEDGRFYEHGGVDWRSAGMAAWDDLRSLHIRRGASTITMQLQRLRDPRPRTFWNKFDQAVRAEQIERRSTKRQILVEYLNRAPFGGNLVGAGAASWRYFGRPCAQLSLGEAAMLAGLPQSPNRLRPDRHPEAAVARRNHVLDRMFAEGMIDTRQHAEACAEPNSASWRPLPQRRDESFPTADGAMPTLSWLGKMYRGRDVRSTIDAGIQKQVAAATREHLGRLASSRVTGAAVVVLDTQSAECLAAVSVAGDNPQLDLTRQPRSTGSALKPFIYAMAFDMGVCTPQSVLEDSPTAWTGYEPADYDRRFRGSMTASEALADSRNIPAMVVLGKVGVEPAIGLMESAGLRTLARSDKHYGLSLAIGGADATPMELSQAYAMLARGGTAREVVFVEQEVSSPATETESASAAIPLQESAWTDEHLNTPCLAAPLAGRVQQCGSLLEPYLSPRLASKAAKQMRGNDRILDSQSFSEYSTIPVAWASRPCLALQKNTGGTPVPQVLNTVLRPSSCWSTLSAISGAERTMSICPAAARLQVAWKTGTSSGHRDAWCAAVTRRRTVVVWLGNAGGQGSPDLVGAETAAPLALRLIASLDPDSRDPWPPVPAATQPSRMAEHVVARASAVSLAMISPTSGQQFVLDPDSDPSHQRVLLRAALHLSRPGAGDVSRTLWWFVDGQPVGVADVGVQVWWPPIHGAHEVRVIDSLGHAATARISVR